MSIISEILQKADFQATIKAFIALFMDFNRPWQAGHPDHPLSKIQDIER